MVLLSLLCSGVNQAREALDRTVTAQIAQQLIGMAQQTDWSQASELGSTYYYFDETGQLLDGPGNFNAVFSACIQIRSSVDLPADGSNPTNDQVATIRVRVVRDPGHKLSGTPTFDSGGKMRRSEFREFSAFMANNGA